MNNKYIEEAWQQCDVYNCAMTKNELQQTRFARRSKERVFRGWVGATKQSSGPSHRKVSTIHGMMAGLPKLKGQDKRFDSEKQKREGDATKPTDVRVDESLF